jgi:hypothetical protein
MRMAPHSRRIDGWTKRRHVRDFATIHPGKVDKLVLVEIGPDIAPIEAERDIFPPDPARRMQEIIPGSRLVEIPGPAIRFPPTRLRRLRKGAGIFGVHHAMT